MSKGKKLKLSPIQKAANWDLKHQFVRTPRMECEFVACGVMHLYFDFSLTDNSEFYDKCIEFSINNEVELVNDKDKRPYLRVCFIPTVCESIIFRRCKDHENKIGMMEFYDINRERISFKIFNKMTSDRLPKIHIVEAILAVRLNNTNLLKGCQIRQMGLVQPRQLVEEIKKEIHMTFVEKSARPGGELYHLAHDNFLKLQ